MIQPAFEILNQRGTPMFFSDTFANIPTAGIVGRIFIRTDSPYGIYRDTGSTWEQIAGSGGGGGNTIYTGDDTLTGNRTVSLGGYNLVFDGAASVARVRIDADNGVARIFSFATDNVARWAFRVDGTETGSNAGADFAIRRYNDAGTFIDSPFSIVRSTGQIFAGASTTASGKLVVNSSTSDNHLQVIGANGPSIRIDNAGSGATQRFVMGLATATNNFIQGSAAGNICISTASASPLLFGMWQTTNASEVMRISTANNLLIGQTTDSGQRLQISGNGALITGGFETFAGSERSLWLKTSTSSKQSVEIVLENTFTTTGGLYEISSQSDGAYRIYNRTINRSVFKIDRFGNYGVISDATNTIILGNKSGLGSAMWMGTAEASTSTSNYVLYKSISDIFINSEASIYFRRTNLDRGVIFFSTGNWLIQTGGTLVDAGYKLDVQGTSRFTNTMTLPSGTWIKSNVDNADRIYFGSADFTVFKCGNGGTGFEFRNVSDSIIANITRSGSFILGNGTTDISSAILQVTSTTKGFLPPRMTTAQKNGILTPAAGLVVYDTTLNKLCVYTTAWETITSV